MLGRGLKCSASEQQSRFFEGGRLQLNGQGESLVVQPRQLWQKYQMTRGGHRQELGDALDDGEYNYMEKRHFLKTKSISMTYNHL